jgi:HAMP domain-containing protein
MEAIPILLSVTVAFVAFILAVCWLFLPFIIVSELRAIKREAAKQTAALDWIMTVYEAQANARANPPAK